MNDYLIRQKEMFSKTENIKLEKMNVMIAGAGGLGTHQAQQLQRIGINKIYIYDHDKIEASNLNRQVFYSKDDIGKNKADTAKEYLNNFKLNTEIVSFVNKIDQNLKIKEDIDIIFDALDNFESRFILEELAVKNNIPLIHGGINSWYGQIAAILPEHKLRLKTIFNNFNTKNSSPPVFSPVVSIIASLQVIEGIKVYLKREDILKNKLILIDLLTLEIDKIDIK